MKMIPEEIDPTTESDAERELFRRLTLIGDRGDWLYALHSLNLSEHAWKRVAEIDFLLLGPRGILVLEVKGGQVACNRGIWEHRNRYGRTTKKKSSPFSQARSAMFALQERLAKLLDPRLVGRTAFGYGVVFPDQPFDLESVEWSDEMVIDETQLKRQDGVLRSVNRLMSYWRDKPGSRNAVLQLSQVDAYLNVLRPEYDVVPTLQRVADAAELELARLTSHQYRALDAHLRNPRIIFEGGAGTGKTMLAVEICRRRSAAGARVLFTCHSPVMADFVRIQPGMESVDSTTAARLPDADHERYDILVVDEAQDLINLDQLTILDELVSGGLEDGQWVFFLDSNNQKGLVGSFEQDAMSYLHDLRPADFVLSDNCRNTATVVGEVTRLTGADVGSSTAGVGPAVRIDFGETRAACALLVAKELQRLEDEGVSMNQVMLLSPLDFDASVFGALPGRWRQRIEGLDARSWNNRPATRLGFARVADFKGLESSFVILTDLTPMAATSDSAALLYVGMTRARIGLTIVAPVEDSAYYNGGRPAK